MPSANQFAFLREALRNHPVIVATTAATGGVLLGVFVAVQLLAMPKPRPENTVAAQAAVATKAAPEPAAETTGSAPAGENVAANCDQQTWPYVSRACMEEFRAKNRTTRVITTDKLDKPTIEAIETPPPMPRASPVASAPTAPTAPAPAPAPAFTSAVAAITPPAAAESAKPATSPTPVVAAPAPPEAAAATPPQPAAHNEEKDKRLTKKERRKIKRELKAAPKPPVKQDVDDDEDSTFASSNGHERFAEDRGADSRSDRRGSRSRRIVERWTERDYDVVSEGGGRRRVTVIRRGEGRASSGVFGNIFGMGGRDRDDDD
jgi:hypothetical protein